MSKGVSQPWLIVGDFNAILSTKDKLDRVPVTNNEIKDFAECLRDMGVNELQWKGNYYTWTNKQCGRDRISSRIDRAFGNDEWMDKWGHVNVEYGNPSISDHSSMMILLQKTQQHGKFSFKFFNVWTEHEAFMEMVEAIWKKDYGNSIMKQVWCKLMDLQHVLKQLNRKEFKYIGKQIEMARLEIAKVQDQLNEQATDELIVQEKELLIKHEKWSMIEESALRQKTRIKWIQLGDANNKFFSSVIKERTQKKQIRNIMSLNGKMLYDPHEIQDEFVMFYKSLMGTSAGKLPAISAQIIKGDIIEAVQSFFTTGKLYKAFNCTLVSLIPKVQNPKTVIEKHISPRSMLKIDLQKAYDLVEWHSWSKCEAAKGLRQGDPMSPFLFDIAMEYLSRKIDVIS
ncbi:uncharacterized protein LOC107019625 [Solanum pennellii]|uniref:Uncharacterized protein LOC107019625 n=1 Tax=Solanum pennellii TaxID=28526 RepID=A0ABM1GSY9_SOLPN|nr:uncharacterized protein LOC107019625 [Solanum pennellii]